MTCGLRTRVLALLKAVSLIRPLWNASIFRVQASPRTSHAGPSGFALGPEPVPFRRGLEPVPHPSATVTRTTATRLTRAERSRRDSRRGANASHDVGPAENFLRWPDAFRELVPGRWTRSRGPNGWGRHPGRHELCSGARHTGKFPRKSLWKVSFAPRERTSY